MAEKKPMTEKKPLPSDKATKPKERRSDESGEERAPPYHSMPGV